MQKNIKRSGFQTLNELIKTIDSYSILSWFWLINIRYIKNKNSCSLTLMPTNHKEKDYEKDAEIFSTTMTELLGHSNWLDKLAPLLFETLLILKPDIQDEEITSSLHELDNLNKAIIKLLTTARALPENSVTARLVKTKRLREWLEGRFTEIHEDFSLSIADVIKKSNPDAYTLNLWKQMGHIPYDYGHYKPKIFNNLKTAIRQKRSVSKVSNEKRMRHVISVLYRFSQELIRDIKRKSQMRKFYTTLLTDKELSLALSEIEKKGFSKRFFGKIFVQFILKQCLLKNYTLDQIEDQLKKESQNIGLKSKSRKSPSSHKNIFDKLDIFYNDIYKDFSLTKYLTDLSFAYEAFHEWAQESPLLSVQTVSKYKIQKKHYDLIKQRRVEIYNEMYPPSPIDSNKSIIQLTGISQITTDPISSYTLDKNVLKAKPPFILPNYKISDLFLPEEEESF